MTNRATGWAAQKDQYAVPVMFNPYTGEPRDVRDVQSDPQGILIAPPGRVEMLAATPPAQAADSVLEDAARLEFAMRHGMPMERDGQYRYHGFAALGWHPTKIAAIDAARKQGANHD